MPSRFVTVSFAVLVAQWAIIYQFIIKDLLRTALGIGREVQPLADFPYQCRRLTAPGLEACEDMWLSPERRTLYLACSDSLSRVDWMPNIARFNVTGRPRDDKIIAMQIDKPEGTGYEYSRLNMPKDYTGVNGDKRLYLVGMTGLAHADHDELFFVNARPALDTSTGELTNQKSGGNSTIEHITVSSTGSIKHIKTWAHEGIRTPNRVAPLADGSFYFTNDHGPHKRGWLHTLSDLIGFGDVGFCDSKTSDCESMSAGHRFPNGLALGKDGLLYVPSAATGGIQVYRPHNDGSLAKLEDIDVPMPLDNISPDVNGDLYIAGLPKILQSMVGFDYPLNLDEAPPATVWRVHPTEEGGYEVEKVLEDRDAEALPGATTAVHDAVTGRIFVSGVFSPFFTVCERKGVEAVV